MGDCKIKIESQRNCFTQNHFSFADYTSLWRSRFDCHRCLVFGRRSRFNQTGHGHWHQYQNFSFDWSTATAIVPLHEGIIDIRTHTVQFSVLDSSNVLAFIYTRSQLLDAMVCQPLDVKYQLDPSLDMFWSMTPVTLSQVRYSLNNILSRPILNFFFSISPHQL